MSNRRALRGSTKCCPKCASTRLAYNPALCDVAECANCGTRWEPFDPAQLVADDPLGALKECCNTCAFRPGDYDGPGAAERTPEAWRATVARMQAGMTFHCHKGLPISGDEYVYPADTTKVRLCRGYVDAFPALFRNFIRDHVATQSERAAA
jgi:hypothetical protein